MSQKVLVVYDNESDISLLVDILKDAGYTIFSADNGLQVIEMAYNLKPDAILLDVMMPMMDGFQVCELLKDDSDTKDIPVIMISSKSNGNDLHKAFELGAFDYIKKPIDEIELLARLKSALKIKEYQDMLKTMATRDKLTGLYNHALLHELLQKELVLQERQNKNIAFVMIDIDFFKRVNDAYGHTSGDVVLRELAVIIRDSVRASDIVGRYGGEEFSLILSDIKLEDVISLCEEIRRDVEKHRFRLSEKTIHITISMGIFFKSSENTVTLDEMVKKADEALYTAKNGGRNKVVVYKAIKQ